MTWKKKLVLKKNRTEKWQKQCQPQHIEFVNTNRQICCMQDLGRPHRRPLQAGKRELDFNFLGKSESNQTTQPDGHILVTLVSRRWRQEDRCSRSSYCKFETNPGYVRACFRGRKGRRKSSSKSKEFVRIKMLKSAKKFWEKRSWASQRWEWLNFHWII